MRDAAASSPRRPFPPDVTLARDAVVDASVVCAGLWLSYLLVLFYLLVGAAGVTQRDLLLSDVVSLPFLSGVQLPLQGFAALGPLIFVVTHAYVMLHLSLLASKVAALEAALARIDDASARSRLREELPLNIFVQLFTGPDEVQRGARAVLLGLAASISLVFGPVGLLVFFVLQFLPSHDDPVIWLQRLLVVLDLVLLWVLGPGVVIQTRRVAPPGAGAAVTVGALTVMVLVSAAALLITDDAATYRGEWLHAALPRGLELSSLWRRKQHLWHDHLVLEQAALSGDGAAGAGFVASLKGRNLERAVLRNSLMQRFDFSGADLRGAVLDFAQLQGSHLDGARLDGASLPGAKLQGATLEGAVLTGANLASAQLQGANLLKAHLEGANLDHAQLQGAILEAASLDGAILDDAQLQGASLKGTSLRGASLRKAFVWRADPAMALVSQARVADPITDRREGCLAAAASCPWDKPVDDLKELLGRHVTLDDVETIVQRLQSQMLPADSDARDTALKASWDSLTRPATPDAFGPARVSAWRSAGCALSGSPFVAKQMAKSLLARPAVDEPELAPLAAALLEANCEGKEGLSAKSRAALVGLRDSVVVDATVADDPD